MVDRKQIGGWLSLLLLMDESLNHAILATFGRLQYCLLIYNGFHFSPTHGNCSFLWFFQKMWWNLDFPNVLAITSQLWAENVGTRNITWVTTAFTCAVLVLKHQGNSISQCGSLKINRRLVRFISHCFQKGLMLDLMWTEPFCHRLLSRVTQSCVSFIGPPYCMSSASCFPCLTSLLLCTQFFTGGRKIYGISPNMTVVTFPEFLHLFVWLCVFCFFVLFFHFLVAGFIR